MIMEWLRFSDNSVPFFTQFILSLVITITFLRLKGRSTSIWLAGSFAGLTSCLFTAFFKSSVYAPWEYYCDIPSVLFLLFGNIFSLQFAYRFPRRYREREARIVFIISLIIGLIGIYPSIHI